MRSINRYTYVDPKPSSFEEPPVAEVLARIIPEHGAFKISIEILDSLTGKYRHTVQYVSAEEVVRGGVLPQVLPYLIQSMQRAKPAGEAEGGK